MKKSKLLLLLFLLFSVFVSSSCSCFNIEDDETEIEFSITATSSTYYLEDPYIILSYSDDSIFDVSTRYVKGIEFFIEGEDNVEAEIVNYENYATFKANKIGTVKIQAKYKDVLSSNTLEIVCDVVNEDISSALENVFDNKLSLGNTYYAGIDYDFLDIDISGAEGIIELNEDKRLEIVGIGDGEITIKRGEDILYEGEYSVSRGGNIAFVLNELLKNNHITSLEDTVDKSKLLLVEELDFSTSNVNYVQFLKYFTNLKKLNVSNLNFEWNDDLLWLNNLTKLEELYIDNTNIADLEMGKITSLINLQVLSLKNNRLIKNISFLSGYTKLKRLDFSDTYVSDISSLKNLTELESLSLSNTKVTSLESLTNHSKLIDLDVSNVDVSFNDVKSLNNFNNMVSLGLDGFNDVDLDVLSKITSLTELSLSNCDLANKDITPLNKLSKLRYIDISFNGFDDSDHDLALDGDELWELDTIRIGGNNFTVLPNLLDMVNHLEVLDLSHSYYLQDIGELSEYWLLKELILDYCNNLDFGNDDEDINSIYAGSAPRKISIRGSLMSFDENFFEGMAIRTYLSLRVSGENYYHSNEEGYLKGYYTSLLDYLDTLDKNYNEQYVVEQVDEVRDIVLYLTDNNEDINEYYELYIPEGINSITIYGRGTYNLKLSFDVKGEVDLYLADVNISAEYNVITGGKVNVIAIHESSGLRGGNGSVSYKDQNNFTYNYQNGYSAIDGSNIYLTAYGDASLNVRGGNGGRGYTGGSGDYNANDRHKKGSDGSDGGVGIRCSSLIIDSPNVTITGGDGGSGGQGGAGVNGALFSNNKQGGNGGKGGNGGVGVLYLFSITNDKNAVIKGGYAGNGGYAGPGKVSTFDGEAGEPGEDGLSVKIGE